MNLKIIFLFLLVTSSYIPYVDAEFDIGDIRSFLEESENDNCEYVSLQNGMYAPIDFRLFFDANPTFKGIVEPLDSGLEYSEETNIGENEGTFRFTTDSIGEFRITFTETQNRTNVERHFYYKIEVSDSDNNANIEQELGNWSTDERKFCKIIELRTQEPFKERTEDEILEIVEREQKLRDEETQRLISQANAVGIASAVGIVLMAIYVGSDKVVGLLRKGKSEKDVNKLKKMLGSEIEKIKDLRKFQNITLSKMGDDFKMFRSMMSKTLVEWVDHINDKTKPFKPNLEPKPNPYLVYEKEKKDLKKIPQALLDKLTKKDTDEIEDFVAGVKDADTDELYKLFEDWRNVSTHEPNNQEAHFKVEAIHAEIEKRIKTYG